MRVCTLYAIDRGRSLILLRFNNNCFIVFSLQMGGGGEGAAGLGLLSRCLNKYLKVVCRVCGYCNKCAKYAGVFSIGFPDY